MTQLCTYTVTHDAGLAPNPFGRWCTLAVCTPNHQGIRLEPGDWIAGFLSAARDNRFLYAMRVTEILERHRYFRDRRFQSKKPQVSGPFVSRCGDNLYYRDEGRWRQLPNNFHGPDRLAQDTRYPWVFVAEHFVYLGRNAAPLPPRFRPLIQVRGCKKDHSPPLVDGFLGWIRGFAPGLNALPLDFEGRPDVCGRGVCTPSSAAIGPPQIDCSRRVRMTRRTDHPASTAQLDKLNKTSRMRKGRRAWAAES